MCDSHCVSPLCDEHWLVLPHPILPSSRTWLLNSHSPTAASFCEPSRFRKMTNQKETILCWGFVQIPTVYLCVVTDLPQSLDSLDTVLRWLRTRFTPNITLNPASGLSCFILTEALGADTFIATQGTAQCVSQLLLSSRFRSLDYFSSTMPACMLPCSPPCWAEPLNCKRAPTINHFLYKNCCDHGVSLQQEQTLTKTHC